MNHAGEKITVSLPAMITATVIAAVILLVIIGIYVYRHLCKKLIGSLQYKREFSQDGVYEGDSVIMTEILYNNSRLPMLRVYCESYFFPDLDLTDIANKTTDKNAMQLFQSRFTILMPYMQIKRRHRVVCRKRGVYQLESAQVHLPGTQRYVDSPSRLYVYPRIEAAPTTPAPVGVLMGESVSRRMLIKDPFSITGVRPYTLGDPFNQINFKQTARAYGQAAQPLRVNALDYCSNRTFMVYINFQTDPADPIPSVIFNSMMESAMSYTADIIRVMSENGYRLGLCTNSAQNDSPTGLDFPMRSGELHAREMLMGMSNIRIAATHSFTVLLSKAISDGLCDTEIFIFSAYTDDEIDSCIAALERNRNTVNLILPSREEDDK